MILNTKELFLKQLELDKNIQENHNVTYESTRNQRLLSFLVELDELANASRCFKFWSNKGSEEDERLLDEFADGLHFILSIGIDFDYCFEDIEYLCLNYDLTTAFLLCHNLFNKFVLDQSFENYVECFSFFLSISALLGFSDEDVINAYFKKLEVNHNRQKNNY